jgi:hypothetical protein
MFRLAYSGISANPDKYLPPQTIQSQEVKLHFAKQLFTHFSPQAILKGKQNKESDE